jgi:2,5-dichloro-2,5-cyclohexadiene-1,4-diol dehydrogenase 1
MVGGLSGRSVIVTGGGSGIGRAAVELLGAAGCLVTVADVDEAGGNDVAAAVNRIGKGCAQFVRTDAANEADVMAMIAAAVAMAGRLDAAINCAGVSQAGKPLHELDPAAWDRCVNINLRGMFLCMKYQIAQMLRGGGGSIVAISSVAALLGLVNSAEYCASKAGITGLVRAAAVDYARSGIRVNALLPGATATPLAMRSLAAKPQDAGPMPVPMGRMAQPIEIARGAVWMISDESSYMTGSCMTLDGALSIA